MFTRRAIKVTLDCFSHLQYLATSVVSQKNASKRISFLEVPEAENVRKDVVKSKHGDIMELT